MNLAVVTSFIIAGMLMLSIISMNLRMSASSAEMTLTVITREHVVNVSDILNDDIPNMGYNVTSPVHPSIVLADSTRIRFYRNIGDYRNSANEYEAQLITWELLEVDEDFTPKNDNHRTLRRTVSYGDGTVDETNIRTGVTRFRLRYYDEHGRSTDPADGEHLAMPVSAAERANIKQIYLELEMQSAERITYRAGSEGRYIRSVYEKRYSPRNLDLAIN